MARNDTTALKVAQREPSGSRATRRLRREGMVPGVVYGGDQEPMAFQVDARELRQALAHAGALLDLSVDGSKATPVVLKELARHPVNGETMHVDLLRVRLDRTIQATVTLELVGADDAPGAKEGGVLEQVTRELTIEALPGDIPDTIQHDVSAMEINDTLTLAAVSAPASITLLGDPEMTIATITPPRLQLEDENEIEAETEVVGEGEAPAAAEGDAGAPDAGDGGDADSAGE